ncbi:ELWxxDGT repeat protein [Archangium gephyra]|uniref:ELWxxDGT repeat protein n=1 Tax=Archangium gephyra TaxID=48 RepID=UPI003B7C8DE8
MRRVWMTAGGLALVLASLGGCSASESEEPGPVRTQAHQGLAAAVPVELVRDIRVTPAYNPSSDPTYFTASGGKAYFFASVEGYGRELWVTDGTPEGTRLVKDLWPGPYSPVGIPSGDAPRDPGNLRMVDVGGVLYFPASVNGSDHALWRTDRTPTGTVEVKEICANFCPAEIGALTAFNGRLLFAAAGDSWDTEPWVSDGTAAGTVRLKDIFPGSNSSLPRAFTAWNGAMYFLATTGRTGFELWRTDGTPSGTVQVSTNPALPPPYSNVTALAVAGGRLYFAASDAAGEELWVMDGTPSGTRRVKDLNPGAASSFPHSLTSVGGRLYFVAGDSTGTRSLWVTDGTEAGTVLLRTAASGWAPEDEPRLLTPLGERLFFIMDDGLHGEEPWVTDGTPEGTRMLGDLMPEYGGSEPGSPTAVGSALYFVAYSPPDYVSALWVTDGTPEGTRRVPGGTSGLAHAAPRAGAVNLRGRLLFSGMGADSSGFEPWVTDGTPEGTRRVKDVAPPLSSSNPAELTGAGGRLFLRADDGVSGSELWTSDGTPAGTKLVLDIKPGSPAAFPHSMRELGGALTFFTGNWNHQELWRSDGTPAGTVRLRTFQPTLNAYQYGLPVLFEGHLYFMATDATAGMELWRSNGTAAGTSRVVDLWPGTSSGTPGEPTPMGGVLYFTGNDGVTGMSLWKTNGTAAGTVRVRTLSGPRELTPFGGALYLSAHDPATSRSLGLWKSNGTAAGTVLVKPHHISLSSLTVLEGSLYYFAGDELWRSNGSPEGTVKVAGFDTGNTAISSSMVTMRGALFFSLQGPLGEELWRSDGTMAGTRLLRDFSPGPASGVSRQPFLVLEPEGILLVAASDGSAGMELWATDGADLWRVTDVAPGDGNANPGSLTRVGAFVYFTADDGTGTEPWRLPVKALEDVTPPTLTCPADQKAEATAQDGAVVHYTLAPPSDDRTSAVAVKYSQASGTKFPLGKSTVTVTATDTAGNTSSCSFQVSVVDTTRPHLICPSELTRQEATSPAGTPVNYPSATATDQVSPPVTLSYNPAQGDTFPLGFTLVSVTATDGAGNQRQCGIQVLVVDTTAPSITCPAEVTTEATSTTGAAVSWEAAKASDAVTLAPEVTYSQSSGTEFPLGATRLTVTASDAAGNASSCDFTVTVRDTTPPEVTCPMDLTTEPASAEGRRVDFTPATARDTVSLTPELTYSHPPGSTFPLGTTAVTVQARDAAGNTASCGFQVTVPPMPVSTDAGTDGGTQTPDDGGTQTPDDGGTQTPDDGGVREPDIEPDTSGCGCSAGNASASTGWGALLLLGWVMTRRRGMPR